MSDTRIIIPNRFKDQIVPDVEKLYSDATVKAGNSILEYFMTSPTYFGEYTVHGIDHINNVISYADKLIPDNTLKLLKKNPNTISVLLLGIIFHDMGMFITKEGLLYLINNNIPYESGTNTKKGLTWNTIWNQFINHLKHASEKELESIYEDEGRVYNETSDRTCSTFIRIHHHELAYHIAVKGFPGATNHIIYDEKDVFFKYAKLAGILAKSHGMALRDMEGDIKPFGYEDNMPLDIPIYYLMAILRLADLLDADKNRAPKILMETKKFNSNYSINEWVLNQAIEAKQWPRKSSLSESLHIVANPESTKNYLDLKGWLEYWQKELDLSWVVLGEKGYYDYKLSIRRIYSTAFDREKEYSFVTNPVELKVNPEIVKLLAAPLYGDDPSYGVRELLQNAIDACNERTVIEGTEGKIIVEVDTVKGIFKITDNGIGMNEEVISEFFLNVGASFRCSSYWISKYVDDNNNPKYVRNGRFGIGALAAFLIGKEIKVTTKPANEEKGYCFNYSIHSEKLNIDKCTGLDTGTTLEIKMEPETSRYFAKKGYNWTKWYCFNKPNIEYFLNGYIIGSSNLGLDLMNEDDVDSWFYVKQKDYENFHWSVERTSGYRYICNGFIIKDEEYSLRYRAEVLNRQDCYLDFPSISLLDRQGIFPIDLARKRVLMEYTLDDTIIEEMCKYYIAELLVFGYSDECLICSRGYIPCNKAFIRNIDEPIYLIGIEEYGYSPNVYSSDEILNESESGVALMDMTDYRYVSSADFPDGLAVDIDNNIYIDELWIRKSTFDSLNHSSHQQDNIKYKKICCISDDSTCELFCHIPKKCINNRVKGVFKYTYKHYEMDDTIMFKMVREYLPNNINDGWIPLDEDKRKEMFKDSYKKLERYVTHFQKREEQRREKRRYNISKCILS